MFKPGTGRALVRVERHRPRGYVGSVGEVRGPVQTSKATAAAAAVTAAEAELSGTYAPRLLAWPAKAAGEPAPHQWACHHAHEFTPGLPAALSGPGEARWR